MTKKILKNFLVLSSIASIGGVALFAVSCFENKKGTTTETKDDLNKIMNNISASFKKGESINVDNVKQTDVVFDGYDTAKYTVNITAFNVDKTNKKVKITIQLENKTTNLKSDSKDIEINFDVDQAAKDKVNNDLLNVTIDYKNKANTLITEAKESGLIFEGYDKTLSQPIVTEIKQNPDDDSISVSFKLAIKNSIYQTQNRTIKIEGFKDKEENADEKILNEELENVKVDYDKKQDIFALDADVKNVTSSGFDNTKYKTIITNAKVNSDLKSITVEVKLGFKNNSIIESKTVKKIITGFKPQTSIANRVTVDYRNKANTYAYLALDYTDIIFSNYLDENRVGSPIEIILNPDKNSITVKYLLINNKTFIESPVITQVISGFEPINLKLSTLSDIFITKDRDFLKIGKDQKSDILNSLDGQNATFVFNITDYEFVRPQNNKKIDLQDKFTYSVLGKLNKEFVDENKLFFETLISSRISSGFDQLKTLLEAKEADQQKLFETFKANKTAFEESAKNFLTFSSNWLDILQVLIRENDQRIMFNLQTLEFVTPVRRKDFDPKDPTTYRVLAKVDGPNKNTFIQAIKDRLTLIGLSETTIKAIFNPKISVFYTLRKINDVLFTSITFTQKSR